MLERVTKAISDASDNWYNTRPDSVDKEATRERCIAQAAIDAIRNPSSEELNRMHLVSGQRFKCPCGQRITQFALNKWQVMIDAALDEKPEVLAVLHYFSGSDSESPAHEGKE